VLFTEPLFLFLFLPALLILTFVRRPHDAYANWVLAVASVVFYAVGGGWFTLLMLASIAFNYWMAILVDRARHSVAGRSTLIVAVGVNVVVLALFTRRLGCGQERRALEGRR
jgi:alginate O-acetyltransferase complex protein AlgI